jgi:methylated-DNA-[protein]-cysteine S-methyltransferase
MTGELKYTIFDTSRGWVGILGSSYGLLHTTLPQHSVQEAKRLLGDRLIEAVWSDNFFKYPVHCVRSYFSGYRVAFTHKLDLSLATVFQRQVWEITRLIPYGETRSYSWVAEQLGRAEAVRAVGRALAGNPLPIIIPCHRVLAKDGAGGYSSGVEMKKYLLWLETSASIR